MIEVEWAYLLISGILVPLSVFAFEKLVKDSTIKWAFLFLILLIVSTGLLWLSLEEISKWIAYAVWSAIGVIGTVIIRIKMGDEQMTTLRIILVMLLLIGIVGILLTGGM